VGDDQAAAAAPNPTNLAAVQLPPLSSFAGDSGRPLKCCMLSKLLPLLEVAGAAVRHVSGMLHTYSSNLPAANVFVMADQRCMHMQPCAGGRSTCRLLA
jgi:hypothetical protein